MPVAERVTAMPARASRYFFPSSSQTDAFAAHEGDALARVGVHEVGHVRLPERKTAAPAAVRKNPSRFPSAEVLQNPSLRRPSIPGGKGSSLVHDAVASRGSVRVEAAARGTEALGGDELPGDQYRDAGRVGHDLSAHTRPASLWLMRSRSSKPAAAPAAVVRVAGQVAQAGQTGNLVSAPGAGTAVPAGRRA